MNYERIVRQIRRDPRLFDTPDDHKIHRILRRAITNMIVQRRTGEPREAVGPYSGLTKHELAESRTCEPDWY
jgi:hypothetical protein